MLISVKSYSEDVYLMRDVLLKHFVCLLYCCYVYCTLREKSKHFGNSESFLSEFFILEKLKSIRSRHIIEKGFSCVFRYQVKISNYDKYSREKRKGCQNLTDV